MLLDLYRSENAQADCFVGPAADVLDPNLGRLRASAGRTFERLTPWRPEGRWFSQSAPVPAAEGIRQDC